MDPPPEGEGQDLATDSAVENEARDAMHPPATTSTTSSPDSTPDSSPSTSDSSRKQHERVQAESSGSPAAGDGGEVDSEMERGASSALESDPMLRRPSRALLHAAREYLWPSRQGFNKDIGVAAIAGYIKLLQLHVTWRWNVEYIGDKDGTFQFKAWFGQPSRGRPLPYPVVNLYFEIYTNVPTDCVETRFAIETYHTVRNPREIFFREDWLDTTLDIKRNALQGKDMFMITSREPERPDPTTMVPFGFA